MSTTYGFTNKYLTKDEKPWFPVMGEIHFSRYRADLWEESLRKMKAGGLAIASVYVI
jgi:beta-galactosidase